MPRAKRNRDEAKMGHTKTETFTAHLCSVCRKADIHVKVFPLFYPIVKKNGAIGQARVRTKAHYDCIGGV